MPKNPYRGIVSGYGLTKTQRLHFERLRLYGAQLETEDISDYDVELSVPQAWDTLERDLDVEEKKVKISLRLDESVAKFYRAMGPGYQARINRILATFAQMRMVEVKEQSARIAAERARLRAKLENG